MVVTANQVKELREKSGAGIMECKRALEQVEGDIAKAVELLKQQGLAKADKKTGRAASQGLIEPYIHGAGRIGSIVEVNCETDFVARTPEFRELAHDLAMQVAATSPAYVSVDDVPESAWADLEKEYGDREKADGGRRPARAAVHQGPEAQHPGPHPGANRQAGREYRGAAVCPV